MRIIAMLENWIDGHAKALVNEKFEQLGLSGSAIKLRQNHSFIPSTYSALADSNAGRLKASNPLRSSDSVFTALQPGNTIAVAEIYGDLALITAYGTVTYTLSNEWLAFGHSYTSSGEQITKPVFKAKMITMIDTSPLPRKLALAYGSVVGAMSADYLEGIRVKSGGAPSMIDATTKISYQNLTNSYAHKVAFDIDHKFH